MRRSVVRSGMCSESDNVAILLFTALILVVSILVLDRVTYDRRHREVDANEAIPAAVFSWLIGSVATSWREA